MGGEEEEEEEEIEAEADAAAVPSDGRLLLAAATAEGGEVREGKVAAKHGGKDSGGWDEAQLVVDAAAVEQGEARLIVDADTASAAASEKARAGAKA